MGPFIQPAVQHHEILQYCTMRFPSTLGVFDGGQHYEVLQYLGVYFASTLAALK